MPTLLALAALAEEPALKSHLTVGPPPPAFVEEAVDLAESWVGVPYELGGRSPERGVDCQGLFFVPYSRATGVSWRRYPWDPSYTVASGMLGEPVPGLSAALRGEARIDHLRRGDVLYLLMANHTLEDHPLWTDPDEVPYWPWHTALYLGEGLAIHARPFDEVVIEPVEDLLWDALFATRPHEGMPRTTPYRGTDEDPAWEAPE